MVDNTHVSSNATLYHESQKCSLPSTSSNGLNDVIVVSSESKTAKIERTHPVSVVAVSQIPVPRCSLPQDPPLSFATRKDDSSIEQSHKSDIINQNELSESISKPALAHVVTSSPDVIARSFVSYLLSEATVDTADAFKAHNHYWPATQAEFLVSLMPHVPLARWTQALISKHWQTAWDQWQLCIGIISSQNIDRRDSARMQKVLGLLSPISHPSTWIIRAYDYTVEYSRTTSIVQSLPPINPGPNSDKWPPPDRSTQALALDHVVAHFGLDPSFHLASTTKVVIQAFVFFVLEIASMQDETCDDELEFDEAAFEDARCLWFGNQAELLVSCMPLEALSRLMVAILSQNWTAAWNQWEHCHSGIILQCTSSTFPPKSAAMGLDSLELLSSILHRHFWKEYVQDFVSFHLPNILRGLEIQHDMGFCVSSLEEVFESKQQEWAANSSPVHSEASSTETLPTYQSDGSDITVDDAGAAYWSEEGSAYIQLIVQCGNLLCWLSALIIKRWNVAWDQWELCIGGSLARSFRLHLGT